MIIEIARRQHSAVGRKQLLPLGVTRQEIATRLADSRLEELYRGVYLVGGVVGEHTLAQAALLAINQAGALSHLSAARIWKLVEGSPKEMPWVTTPGQCTRRGIHVCRATLTVADERARHGMRLTSPPRTVLDCAALMEDDYEYEALLAEARYRKLALEGELREQAERNTGKRGIARLRRVLDLPGGPQRTRSRGERAFLRLLRGERFTGFVANSKAFGPELDFVWPELRFAVELDGWDGHGGRIAFERDRLKVAELQTLGVEVMPVTGRQIRNDRAGVCRRLESALHARRHLLGPNADRL